MFRKKKLSDNPEIRKAMAERDEALADAKDAVHEVDKLVDDLLHEYEEANGIDPERGQ